MVDRIARGRLTSALRSYMNEEITAFQFDEQLEAFRPFPTDKTVECIARDLWVCYDDLKDHKVVASKQTWDLFNRMLLLLASDAEIEQVCNGLRWRRRQIFAGVCCLLGVLLSARIGWSNFLMVSIPFGIVSVAIWYFDQKRLHNSTEYALYPFSSFGALSLVRRSIRTFSKTALPKAVRRRKIRRPAESWMYWGLWGTLWLIFSPVVLFLQALPRRAWEMRLKTSLDCY